MGFSNRLVIPRPIQPAVGGSTSYIFISGLPLCGAPMDPGGGEVAKLASERYSGGFPGAGERSAVPNFPAR
jgi:hypothetical protein